MPRQQTAYGAASRRPLWIAGIAVLVIVVVLIVIREQGASSADMSRAGLLPKGPVVAGEGGTRTASPDIQVGFARTADGAVAAATSHLMLLNSTMSLDSRNDTAILDATVSAQTRNAHQQDMVQFRSMTAPFASAISVDPKSGAYELTRYNETSAEVRIWCPLLITPREGVDGLGSTSWTTTTVSLIWQDNDWKLSATLIVSPKPDPKPIVAQPSPRSRAETVSGLGDFKEYANAPT